MGIHLWAFVGVAALVILLPGPDTAVVTKNAIAYGPRTALTTGFGVNTGLAIWTVAAALGIAALVKSSEVAFTVLKVLGACYLAWLGAQALLAARRAAGEPITDATVPATASREDPSLGFRQGLLSDLGNPKIAIFFTSLLPQFVSSGHPDALPFLIMGAIFVAMTLAYLSAYAILASRFLAVLTRPRVRATLDRITGVVLIGLGLRLALERR